jgi:tetrahydromethanopterin S-methyltransferase subunit G
MGILMIISFLDFYFGIYFITKNLIIIQHQIDTFYNILKILIENKQSKIRIESVRRLYSCLFNHVKTADNWIGYYFGIYYTTVIPIFIIYLYASVFGGLQIEMIKNNSAILILYAYFLVLLTTIAVRLNSKV